MLFIGSEACAEMQALKKLAVDTLQVVSFLVASYIIIFSNIRACVQVQIQDSMARANAPDVPGRLSFLGAARTKQQSRLPALVQSNASCDRRAADNVTSNRSCQTNVRVSASDEAFPRVGDLVEASAAQFGVRAGAFSRALTLGESEGHGSAA